MKTMFHLRNRWGVCLDVLLSLVLLTLGLLSVLDYGSCVLHLNIDFGMRYNEAHSVLSGNDPFLVWKGLLPPGIFTPFDFRLIHEWHAHQFIHAYPPWCYAFMLPFSLLDFKIAAWLYFALEICAVLSIFAFAAIRLHRLSGVWWPSCLCFALMCWSSSDAFTRCLIVGNYGIVITFAVFGAILLHQRSHDLLAGVVWAFIMLKPQLGGLFLLTLLLERRWRTLLMAGSVLGAATLLSAALCGRSPWTMVISIGEYSRGMFDGTGFFVPPCFQLMLERMGESPVLLMSAAVGVMACIALWMLVRKCTDIWVRFLPAMLLSVAWATFRLHDMSIHLLPAYIAVIAAFTYRTKAVTIASIFLGASLGIRENAYYWAPFVAYANLFVIISFYLFARAIQEAEGRTP